MEEGMLEALREYGGTIKRKGWKAGEPLIQRYSEKWKNFKKWARALGIMLRAKELLEE
jgi:phage terminase small subunit